MSRKNKHPDPRRLIPGLLLPAAALIAWALIGYGGTADRLFRVALKLAVIP